MGKEIGIGVIGAGGRGHLAWHTHNPENGVFFRGGADINEDELEEVKEKFGEDVFLTTDYRKLLERKDINAVFVTTPDFLHEEHAVAALEAGKDVYLEKPMAISTRGCDRILETAYKNKRKLYVGHNMRQNPFVKKMKELIDSGRIGEVKAGWCRHFVSYGGDGYFKDWHAERRGTNSLLLHKGSHDIDILHYLCKGLAEKVTAMGGLTLYDRITDRHPATEKGDPHKSHDHWPPLSLKQLHPVIDVEDISMMLMQLENGVFASYQQCHYTPDAWRNYTIIGTEGRIENFGDRPGATVIRLWNKRYDYQPYGDEIYFVATVAGGHGGADPTLLSQFIQYVREGGKVTTSPITARYSVAAGCCAAESIRNGNIPCDVPPLSPEVYEYFAKDLIDKI